MRKDQYGQLILSEHDICDLYMQDKDRKFKYIVSDSDIFFDTDLGLQDIPKIKKYVDLTVPIQEFDNNNQDNWLMPDKYKNLDIARYVLDKCNTEAELQRAGEELLLFQERNMFSLLQYLKYLVDTMRENNIVWGVGRGSSVASFVLFLLGVHRINSLYYDLSINEFLK